MNSFFVFLYPDRGTMSAPVSLTTPPQQVPQPGPNSMPGGYWSGGGVPSGPSRGSMYPPPPPLSTGECSSQQSLPSEHPPPPPMSQQLHPRPLQRRARGLYLCNYGDVAVSIMECQIVCLINFTLAVEVCTSLSMSPD